MGFAAISEMSCSVFGMCDLHNLMETTECSRERDGDVTGRSRVADGVDLEDSVPVERERVGGREGGSRRGREFCKMIPILNVFRLQTSETFLHWRPLVLPMHAISLLT